MNQISFEDMYLSQIPVILESQQTYTMKQSDYYSIKSFRHENKSYWLNTCLSWTSQKIRPQSSQSSSSPGWIALLLQLKTQHPQTSVHGILFLRQLHFPSHPRLHPHFTRCNTASGAGGFKQRTGEKWLEPASNVQPNAAGPGRRGWFSLALLQIMDT